jgi:uncharacterized membrane protein
VSDQNNVVLENPETKSKSLTNSLQVMSTFYSAPLPPASEFERYEKASPGAGKIILKMAESEQECRHKLEIITMNTNTDLARKHIEERRRGQWFAFIIVIFSMAISSFFLYRGKNITGGIFGGASIISILIIFYSPSGILKKLKSIINKLD